MKNREELVKQAESAGQAKQFENMAADVRAIVELGGDLSKEERKLFSTAYRSLINSNRSAMRMSQSARQRAGGNVSSREQAEQSFKEICEEVLVIKLIH
jgi:uncharacterized membrane protein